MRLISGNYDRSSGRGTPSKISFCSTLKKTTDIADAYKVGVRHFSFDAIEELIKIANYAQGARVSCRFLTNDHGTSAQWPLNRKFGCDESMAIYLMSEAAALDLVPSGISFHVGSQQTEPSAWHAPITQISKIFNQLAGRGIALDTINLGGSYPTKFGDKTVPNLSTFNGAIKTALNTHFSGAMPRLIAEPGRTLVGIRGL